MSDELNASARESYDGLYYFGARNGSPEVAPAGSGDQAPETTGLALIPASEVSPEDIGTLSLRYENGQPVIVVSGGKYIPAKLEDPGTGFPSLALELADLRDPEFSREERYWRFDGDDLEQAGEPKFVPAEKVNPAEVARLALTYRNNVPAVVAVSGQHVPTWLPVIDEAGGLVAAYTTTATDPALLQRFADRYGAFGAKPHAADPRLIPASKVNPEDIGGLSLRYADSVAQLVVSGGKYIPSELSIVTSAGAAQELRYSGIDHSFLDDVILVGGQTRTSRAADPDDIGGLSLRYADGVAQIAVSSGTHLPVVLTAVDGAGNVVAAYTAGAGPVMRSGDPSFVLHIYDQQVLL